MGHVSLSLRRSRRFRTATLAFLLIAAIAAAVAVASDKVTAQTVVAAQLAELKQEQVLNKCLAASPKKNTPCITKQSLRLAQLDDREIRLIQGAMDGTEQTCVHTVAVQEISYLKLWKAGSLALHANKRKLARSFFIKSLPIANAQQAIESGCFAQVLAGG